MTRKELVDLLVANYAEDDEVFIQYEDDQGTCVSGIKGIEDVEQTHGSGHYEYKDSVGNYHRIPENESIWKYGASNVIYITDKEWETKHRCIVSK